MFRSVKTEIVLFWIIVDFLGFVCVCVYIYIYIYICTLYTYIFQFDELPISIVEEQQFIFLRLNILREYLERELKMTNLPFEQDLEVCLSFWY